jgi:hypothetical protein
MPAAPSRATHPAAAEYAADQKSGQRPRGSFCWRRSGDGARNDGKVTRAANGIHLAFPGAATPGLSHREPAALVGTLVVKARSPRRRKWPAPAAALIADLCDRGHLRFQPKIDRQRRTQNVEHRAMGIDHFFELGELGG